MTISRSVLLTYPQPKSTRIQPRMHAWCHSSAYGMCTWGTVIMDDPGGKGYDEPYRNGGKDTDYLIVQRPLGPPTRDSFDCPPTSKWYPFCDELTYDILAHKGALPHHGSDEFDLGGGSASQEDFASFLQQVFWGSDFAYFLYVDKSLDSVYNPGGHFSIQTKILPPAETLIYKSKDSYEIEGLSMTSAVVSGTTQFEINRQWEVTGSGIGFYRGTDYMEVGGYLRIGPNINGDLSVVKITGIVSDTELQTTEILYDFAANDSVYYWYSSIKPEIPFPIRVGIEPDSTGQFPEEDGTETQHTIQTKGGMETFTVIETFVPIPWAIPAPYSIRNVPHTNIWLRLDDPSIPFNLNTLLFRVNGENVTDAVSVTLFTGGMELLYDPPVNFDTSSRVYVDLTISCSPSLYTYFGTNTVAGTEFITISGGDATLFQPGGQLKLGPNPAGDWEVATVWYIESSSVIVLEEETEYEYAQGDLIAYTYDDYPVEISYYFDIVDDYKPPYFENIYPYDGMENVPRNHWIMFDIRDEGLGVDISTLSFTVDNMIVFPTIYKFNDNWYRAVYTPSVPYYYNATVCCFATVKDLSSRQNRAFAVWNFHTQEGDLPFILNPNPNFCAYPVHLKSHIGVDLYAGAAGANLHSMIFTWDQQQWSVITYPKVYRPPKED